MSEKVVLTQEQAKAIQTFLRDNGNDKLHLVDWHNASKVTYLVDTDYQPLVNLKASKLATALFIGYELEQPKFQIGDFVVVTYEATGRKGKEEVFSRIKGWVREEGGTFYLEKGHFGADSNNARHATPEEIYWLYELGRDDIGEFHAGDIIISSDFGYPYKVDAFTNIGHTLSSEDAFEAWHRGNIKGIYPADSFKPLPK